MPVTRSILAALGFCLGVVAPRPLPGQRQPPPRAATEALRVFLDCNTSCDSDYLHREITYVNWVRDRQDADVHLLVTSQSTGGGGREYTLRYIGLRAFLGLDDELKFATRQSDTDDEVRQQATRRIGLGLARYAARGAFAGRLKLTFSEPEGGVASASQKPKDPWNLWVFTLGASANLSAESQSGNSDVSGSVRVRRISETWKFSLTTSGSRSHSRYNLNEDSVLRTTTSRYNISSLLVRSLNDHWSLGLNATALRSSVDNYNLLVSSSPAIEYDVFSYKESSRRQVIFVYELGLSHAKYRDTTIYNTLEETRPTHSLTAAIEATQPWGSVNVSLRGSNYLDDFSKNRLSLSGGCSVRIVRGLNFDFYGSYARVRDQLSLAKSGASDQDILLRLKQLKTSYSYSIFTGLSYTFGSKFNNIVNPRFSHTGNSCFCSGNSCFCN